MIAVGGDDLAFHIFHRDKRQAIRGGAAIEQPGNVWMIERGKNIALHHKTPDDGCCVHAALDNLESYLLMKSVALGEINGTHPTAADFTHNPVGTDDFARSRLCISSGKQWGAHFNRGRFKKALRLLIRDQQRLYPPAKGVIAAARFVEERGAPVRLVLESRLQKSLNALVALRSHC